MVKDALSDFLVRLKNAQAVKKESVEIPYTTLLWETAKVLERSGYVKKLDRHGKRFRRTLEITLSYDKDGEGRITGIRRVSKQSRRVYKKANELHPIRHGLGKQVISTSRGLMTNSEAHRAIVGGEVLFEIW